VGWIWPGAWRWCIQEPREAGNSWYELNKIVCEFVSAHLFVFLIVTFVRSDSHL
jgi:hypothetical protein